ncbi:MAG: NAD(P)/FAD-dependent oxidoreductase, partial [Deltaproteobacteria bacterium]
MGEGEKYDVVIVGGGLSGLTCGLYLQEAGMKVLILERAPQAGGLTSSWQVHEHGDADGKKFVLQYLNEEDIVLQYPMHMIFREKYPNFIDVYKHLGILDTNLTEPLKEFNIIDSRLSKHKLKMED